MSRPAAIEPISRTAQFIRVCVYGDNGAGKTPFAAGSRKCLILDADKGTESAIGSGAERWVMNDWDDMDTAADYVVHEGYREFDWVWLDSITGAQVIGIAHIMADLVAVKPHRKVWQIDQGEIGQNMNRLKDWVRIMHGAPINFGLIAHPFRYMDDTEEEPEEKIWPYVQGRNMPQTIMGYMNVIAYMTRRKMKDDTLAPVLIVGGHEHITTRDRFAVLPDRIVRPDMIKIEEAIRRKIGASPPAPRSVGAAIRTTGVAKKALPIKKAAPVKKAVAKKVAPSPQRSN